MKLKIFNSRNFKLISYCCASLIVLAYIVFVGIYLWLYTGKHLLTFNLNNVDYSESSCWLWCDEWEPVSWKNLPEENSAVLAATDIDFSNNTNNISGFPYPIVPDVVHLIYFNKREINFIHMICIRSIVDNHNPSVIFLHCSDCIDNTMEGKYWNMLGEKYRKKIKIIKAIKPRLIFGRKISYIQHASDIARISILMKYGGIYLDNDIYVVKGLHGFRHYEMVVAWDEGAGIGSQVIAAHKDARFLRHWIDSYHNYLRGEWYFNAGLYPTSSVLLQRPELIHRIQILFGVQIIEFNKLYKMNSPDWENFYTIHLLYRHRSYMDADSPIETFDEHNIRSYNRTFGQMARKVLFGKIDLID